MTHVPAKWPILQTADERKRQEYAARDWKLAGIPEPEPARARVRQNDPTPRPDQDPPDMGALLMKKSIKARVAEEMRTGIFYCDWCTQPHPNTDDKHYPFCSNDCSVRAETNARDPKRS